MSIVEKHGAYWIRGDDDEAPVCETFEEGAGLIGAVYQQRTGLYIARLFGKIKDPGFDMPVWDEIGPGALFDDPDEARDHIAALLAKPP